MPDSSILESSTFDSSTLEHVAGAPAVWPAGADYLKLDLVEDGLTWFSIQGDTPVEGQVTIL